MLPTKSHKRSNKNHSTSCELLVQVVQETFDSIQAIAVAHGCLPEVKGQSLFLETLIAQDPELNLDMTRVFVACRLVFMVPESARQIDLKDFLSPYLCCLN